VSADIEAIRAWLAMALKEREYLRKLYRDDMYNPHAGDECEDCEAAEHIQSLLAALDAATAERDTLKARVEELEAALADLLMEACHLDSQVESEFGPYTDGYYNEVIAGARRVLDRKE